MHDDRIIGALETCCRRGEMLRIQNRHVDWERHQIVIPGRHAKDAENRRIPFDPQGRLAPILKRCASLGPNAYVFGSPAGEFVANFKTAWESLLMIANGHETKRAKHGARVDRVKLRQIDLHWHDLRHEGADCPWRIEKVARPAGLEPATPGLEGRCSIQLSYGRAFLS